MKTTDDELQSRVRELLQRRYHRVITGDSIDGYLGEVPELPGCYTAGTTPDEALRNLDEAMALWFEVAVLSGDPIPSPATALRAIA